MRAKIAFRNIFRNRSRTLLSVLMIAGAAAAIILFRGFSGYILNRSKTNAVDNRYNHIQVATQSYWDMAPGSRKKQLIPDSAILEEKISKIPDVTMVSGRMSFYGLLSTGEDTVSAQGVGYEPAKETHFQESLAILEGHPLSSNGKNEVIVGEGLQKRLSIKVGQTITALAYTLDGVINAADLEVVGIFRIGVSEVDAHVFMLPLKTVQTLLDTQQIENLTIRVKDTDETDDVLKLVETQAQTVNPSYHAKSWYELADLYRQTAAFFKMQNRVIETILISLILLGIMNTVGMAVYERTGEIGTIRALGETKKSVLIQFTTEGAIMGVMGVVLGFISAALIAAVVNKIEFKMVLPSASYPVPIKIHSFLSAYLEAGFIGLFASICATWIPASRASEIPVVEALKKNI